MDNDDKGMAMVLRYEVIDGSPFADPVKMREGIVDEDVFRQLIDGFCADSSEEVHLTIFKGDDEFVSIEKVVGGISVFYANEGIERSTSGNGEDNWVDQELAIECVCKFKDDDYSWVEKISWVDGSYTKRDLVSGCSAMVVLALIMLVYVIWKFVINA